MQTRKLITICTSMVMLCLPATVGAKTTKMVSENIRAELQYLLSFVGPQDGPRNPFDPEQIRQVLDFVIAPKSEGVLYHAGELNGAPSAYYDFPIRKNLRDIMQIAYDPDIPSVITSPSSIRLTRWKEIEGKPQPFPRLGDMISDLESPIMVTGVEYIVNTPDANSGTYYDYDLKRTMILFKYRGKNLFISMSKQPTLSNVGKKGLVIGPDQNWEYLYSGKTGVGMSGLGWVRSYMYDSNAITIYYEVDPEKPLTQFAVFKWVKAGWKDINFVKSYHIYNGVLRFAKDFKAILENPDLPNAALIAQHCADIRNLSDEQLRSAVQEHLSSVERICRQEELLPEATIEEMLENRHYLNSLTRDEMEDLVALVYLKQLLGKGQPKRLTSLPVSSKLP